MTFYIWTLFFTVIIKGFLSAMEIAFKTLQRRMIFSDDEKDNNDSDYLDKFIVTTNMFKILTTLCFGGFVFYFLIQISNLEIIKSLQNQMLVNVIKIILFIFSFFVFEIFAGFIPKKIALKSPKKVMGFGIFIVKFLYYIFILFTYPTVKLSNYLNSVFKLDKKVRDDEVTQEEIMMMIDAGGETGTIDDDEREMIANVFEFDDKTAGDIATHRKDIVAIPINSSVSDIKRLIVEERFSRIPVYEDTIDNIIGILHIKDVMIQLIMFGEDSVNLKALLMEPFFVPFTKKTDELFKEMQENKIHLSVVLDEYGGTLGIVSMEDLIEEVMGNILDEYDDEENPEIISNDGINFYIDGKADYQEVCEYLGIELDNEEEYDTMSGFLIGKMGHIPETNEEFKFETDEFEFFAEKVFENRISLIKAVKKEVLENQIEN